MQIAFLDGYKNVNSNYMQPVFMMIAGSKVSGVCWFTNGRRHKDSKIGSKESLHEGEKAEDAFAVDLQIWNGRSVNEQGMLLLKNRFKKRLPDGYDVVLEEPGEYQNDHLLLHVEFDPKS
jgi:hypothetical protein